MVDGPDPELAQSRKKIMDCEQILKDTFSQESGIRVARVKGEV